MSSAPTAPRAVAEDPRVPLDLRNGSAVFLISLAGLMMANLAPLIMAVLDDLGFDVVESGNILTFALLASAIVGLSTARLAAGGHRRGLSAVGLVVAVIGFALAAVIGNPTVIVVAFLVAGAGVGTAISSSGAAIAALRNPNRVSATSGVVNRLLVMVVLAVIPVLGLAQVTVFGALALLSLVGLAVTVWLPATPDSLAVLLDAGGEFDTATDVGPTADAGAASSTAPRTAPATPRTTPTAPRTSPRRVLLAGIGILLVFPLWGTSEDSVWTLAPVLGTAAGMSDQALGFALSAAAGCGAAAMLVVMVFGTRIGRAVPLALALALGGVVKIWIGLTTDPQTLAILIIVVNTIYAFAFVLFIASAAGLDARGSWSGPLIGAYLVGSSFAPIIGAWVIDTVGIPDFGLIMGIVSFVLIVPTVLVARVSTRVETTLNHLGEDAPPTPVTAPDPARPDPVDPGNN